MTDLLDIPLTLDLVRGVAELEPVDRGLRPHRLPARVRERFPDGQLLAMEAQPSGGRLVFLTTATRLELVLHPTRIAFRGADRPRGRVDAVVDGALVLADELRDGDRAETDLLTGATTFVPGGPHTTVLDGLPAGDKRVELWLPHNEAVDLVALRADAAVRPAPDAGPRWVHHGSSISHGSNAASPTGIWPVVAARIAGVELTSLGFGGSALVDPFTAQTMRDTPADLLSVKLGINVVNLDGFRLRTFVPAVHGFLDTIRDGHPDTPLLLVSPIFAGIHETTPGPGAVDPATLGTDQVRFVATGDPADVARGSLTLEVIRRELASLVERRADDPALHYLDGTELYGAADAVRLPLPDGLHPDADTHRLIGERFAARAFAPGAPLDPAAVAVS